MRVRRQAVFESHHRSGSGLPLVLVHGGTSSWHAWSGVIERFDDGFDVLAPTLVGHAGGTPLPGESALGIGAFADFVEEAMDEVGWETAHVAGNSLGGWVAMEMARRGRARSVVAISPAGGWADERSRDRVRRFFMVSWRQARLSGAVTPWAARSALLRRLILRGVAVSGDRMTSTELVQLARVIGAAEVPTMLALLDTAVEAYPDPGVPCLLAWAEDDRLLPTPRYSDRWRAAAPHATWRVLPGVGHVPMIDDPGLVAETIKDWVAATERP